LTQEEKTHIDLEDEKFLLSCLEEVDEFKSTLMESEIFNPDDFILELNKMSTTSEPRSVFPLPYIQLKSIDSAIRSTEEDANSSIKFAARMQGSNDPILSKIGKDFTNHMQNLFIKKDEIQNEDFLFQVKLSLDLKEVMALEGPNRKKYINQGKPQHIEAQNQHANYSLHYSTDVSKLELLAFQFSEKQLLPYSGDLMEDSENISSLSGLV
jgi:hypothetical protein